MLLYCADLLALFTSSLYLAAAFAALVGSWTCNRFGRRNTMLAGALFFLIGVALQTSAFQIGQLVVGRVILGVGVGLTCQVGALCMMWHNVNVLHACVQPCCTLILLHIPQHVELSTM